MLLRVSSITASRLPLSSKHILLLGVGKTNAHSSVKTLMSSLDTLDGQQDPLTTHMVRNPPLVWLNSLSNSVL